MIILLKRSLACLLMTLIATQSVLAAADTHSIAQVGNDHQEARHSHDHSASGPQSIETSAALETAPLIAAELPTEDGEPAIDCKHCCHCHSSSQLLANVLLAPMLTLLTETASPYTFRIDSLKFPPGLRPPIV